MATPLATKKYDLSKADSWFALAQLVWERASAFVVSSAGGALMAWLGQKSGLLPIGWGLIGVAVFAGLYLLFVIGRRSLAASRKDRAAAIYAEHALEHSTINPLEKHFRNQRIRIADLHDPFGEGLSGRTFVGCDLIGPAVILLSTHTVYRGNQVVQGVEYIRVQMNSIRVWPNKLTLFGGVIENCRLHNIILLVPEEQRAEFESRFTDRVPWANDPWPTDGSASPQSVALTHPPPPSTAPETKS